MPIIVESPLPVGTGLTLSRLWLNLAANPADLIALRVSTFSPGKTVSGEVREQAGGRLRLVRRAAKPRRMSAVLVRPPASAREWLDSHCGERVTVRDPDGGKFVAVYLDIDWDRPVFEDADVALTLIQVTSSEAAL